MSDHAPRPWHLALEFHHPGGACWVRSPEYLDGRRGILWRSRPSFTGWLVGRAECVACMYGRFLLYVDAIGGRWGAPRWSHTGEPVSRVFDGVRLVEVDRGAAMVLSQWRRP